MVAPFDTPFIHLGVPASWRSRLRGKESSMYRIPCLGLLAVVCLTFMSAPASAQGTSGASVSGTVTDASGAVMPGVTVEASSPALIEKVRSAVTDERGEYRIVELLPGTYAVTFSLNGFATFKRE